MAMCLLQNITRILTPSTLRSFGAIEVVEKAVDQLTKSLLSQEKGSVGMQVK